MIIEFVLLIPVLFLCFFLLFIFSKHDFVLLRQNISLSEVFDLAVISLLIALITGRVFYIINNFNFQLFYILSFFHLFKFPGVSYIGFFTGGAVGIYLLFRKKKGLTRIFDIFSLSFFPLFVFFLSTQLFLLHIWYILLIAIFLLFLLLTFFMKSHRKYILKDGGISLIFFILICLTTFMLQFVLKTGHVMLLNFSFVQLISIPLILFSCGALYSNQKK